MSVLILNGRNSGTLDMLAENVKKLGVIVSICHVKFAVFVLE